MSSLRNPVRAAWGRSLITLLIYLYNRYTLMTQKKYICAVLLLHMFIYSICMSRLCYVTGTKKKFCKGYTWAALLIASSLLTRLSCILILEIKASFKKMRWNQFPGHRQEDDGERRRRDIRRAKEKNKETIKNLELWLEQWHIGMQQLQSRHKIFNKETKWQPFHIVL